MARKRRPLIEAETGHGVPAPETVDAFGAVVSWLSALRTGIGLLILVGMVTLAATITPQGGSAEHVTAAYGQWLPSAVAGTVGRAAVAIGLNRAYTTWWYLSSLGLLTLSCGFCAFRASGRAWRAAARLGPTGRPGAAASFEVPRAPDDVLTAARSTVERHGFRAIARGDREGRHSLTGARRRWALYGSPVMHLSFLLVALGALLGRVPRLPGLGIPLSYSVDRLPIKKGETAFDPQRRFHFGLRLNEFSLERDAEGQPSRYASDVTVLRDGRAVARRRIEVNRPLRVRGVAFYQSSYGYDSVVGEAARGPVTERFEVPLQPAMDGSGWEPTVQARQVQLQRLGVALEVVGFAPEATGAPDLVAQGATETQGAGLLLQVVPRARLLLDAVSPTGTERLVMGVVRREGSGGWEPDLPERTEPVLRLRNRPWALFAHRVLAPGQEMKADEGVVRGPGLDLWVFPQWGGEEGKRLEGQTRLGWLTPPRTVRFRDVTLRLVGAEGFRNAPAEATQAVATERRPATLGDVTVKLVEVRLFTELTARKDAGLWALWLGFILMPLGSGVALLFPQSSVRISAEQPPGQGERTTVTLQLYGGGVRAAQDSALTALREALMSALELPAEPAARLPLPLRAARSAPWASAVVAIAVAAVAANFFLLPVPVKGYEDATYESSAKCWKCHTQQPTKDHKAVFDSWRKTAHATARVEWSSASPEERYRYSTGYDEIAASAIEQGVACEACHGPARAHYAASRQEKAAMIRVPSAGKMGLEERLSACVRCHARYTLPSGVRFPRDFRPGDSLFRQGLKLDPPQPGRKLQQYNEMAGGAHLAHGVDCVACHVSHPLDQPPQEGLLAKPVNDLCAGCHPKEKNVRNHAPTALPEDTCATCHLPQGSHRFGPAAKPPRATS